MRRPVFLLIMKAVEEHDDYFVQKRNAAGVLGLSCLQKVVAAFRMLAYGVPANALDEYIRIGESTALEALRKFVVAIVEVFGPEYMRRPNAQDTARLLAIGASRGFPGMLGVHRLYALELEKLSDCMARDVQGLQKGAYNYIGSSCICRFMDMACILWHARVAQ